MKTLVFISFVISFSLAVQLTARQSDSLPRFGSTRAYHVGWTSADLSAEIFPGSADATVRFLLSGEDGWTDSTPAVPLIGGTAARTVRAPITRLSPRTVYTYRVAASNATGRAEGEEHRFLTVPPLVQTLAPESITASSAIFRARCNPQGTTVRLWFTIGVDSIYAVITTLLQLVGPFDTECVVETEVSGLTPKTRYFSRAIVCNADYPDVSSEGCAVAFSTPRDTNAAGMVIPLRITTASGRTAMLAFGVHTSATPCLDRALGEYEMPPLPPEESAVSARFLGACLGLGSELDLRTFSSPTQVDTYSIALRGASDEYPLQISWDNTALPYDGEVLLRAGNRSVSMADTGSMILSDEGLDRVSIIARNPHPRLHQPNIVTQCPTADGALQVTLRGLVIPNGLPTIGWFEWGRSADYGACSSPVRLGDSLCAVRVETRAGALTPNVLYHFRLVVKTESGTTIGPDEAFTLPGVTAVGGAMETFPSMVLSQNFPNPGNPMTTIWYELASPADVVLTLYDLLGRLVLTFMEGSQRGGRHSVVINTSSLSSGVYIYQLSTGRAFERRKMVVLR